MAQSGVPTLAHAAKSTSGKVMVRKGALDDLDMEAFRSDEHNEIVEVEFKAGHERLLI